MSGLLCGLGAPGSLKYGQREQPEKPESWAAEQERRAKVLKAAARLFAERGTGVTRRQASDLAGVNHGATDRWYLSDADLLGDVLADFVYGLAGAVFAAFDAGALIGAAGRLEMVVRAWLDYVAAEPAGHRVFLWCLHGAGEAHREQVRMKFESVMETVSEAVRDVVPELGEISEGLARVMRAVLCDPWAWPEGLLPDQRGPVARLIAGMLVAAGTAAAWGDMAGFGPLRGVRESGRRVVDSAAVRTRFSDLLDYVAAGGEVTIRRYGRVVGKVVPAGLGLYGTGSLGG